jgi:hypothetical protein
MSRYNHRSQALIEFEVGNLTVWQALSLLGLARDGQVMPEQRARQALRDIGMKEEEMDEPYPEDGIDELNYLINNPENLDKTVEEASEWMIKRN